MSTVISYKAALFRAQGWLFAVVTVLFAVALLSVPHVAKLSCVRAANTCTITGHSLWTPYESHGRTLKFIERAEYETKTSGKGSYAEVRLHLKSGEVLPLGDGLLGSRFDVGDAKSGVPEINSFLANPNASSLDLVFWSGHLTSILSLIFGLIVARVAFAVVREQVRQYSTIDVKVDHDAKLLHLPGRHKVRFDDVDEIVVNHGRALFWASGKNEHIPGFRIIVRTKNGLVLPLTPDHRVGPEALHEKARQDILAAIGKKT